MRARVCSFYAQHQHEYLATPERKNCKLRHAYSIHILKTPLSGPSDDHLWYFDPKPATQPKSFLCAFCCKQATHANPTRGHCLKPKSNPSIHNPAYVVRRRHDARTHEWHHVNAHGAPAHQLCHATATVATTGDCTHTHMHTCTCTHNSHISHTHTHTHTHTRTRNHVHRHT